MNLPMFLGSQLGRDPPNVIDDVKKIFVVMSVIVVIDEICIL